MAIDWNEAADAVCADLMRFSLYRALGMDCSQAAARMNITERLAQRYENAITALMTDLQADPAGRPRPWPPFPSLAAVPTTGSENT
ncbi:hypothetical protein NE236_41570 [Actinoallomurus purpureus]|uniref:hypothetical protein n=1 Tax=Actinoallomurus purpureus TaxID=478114 RepID=UPI0020936472|nr:hypothetical protein [Actinoallomurus purpureus]MCO6011459.1 hypothetical protein [Actinoallomurus purpureus]